MEKRTFQKGDFIKYRAYNDTTDKITFGIFEGNDLAPQYQYTKKLSLVLYYDSKKYSQDKAGQWGYRPSLEIAKDGNECEKTIDTTIEDSWWSICTEEEKEFALQILSANGYIWDEATMTLFDKDTNEVVHKIVVPKNEYNGNIIKPISDWFMDKLRKFVISKNAFGSYAGTPNYGGGYHPQYGYYNEWDSAYD